MPRTWEPDEGALAHAERSRSFSLADARYSRGRAKGRTEGIIAGVVVTLALGWIVARMRERQAEIERKS